MIKYETIQETAGSAAAARPISGPPGSPASTIQGVAHLKLRKLSKQKWFNGAVIACIGVAFYVILTHLSPILHALWHFLGNFKSIFVGIVFAYVINPVAKFFYYRLFGKMALGQKRWALSVLLAFLTGFLALAVLMIALIPQLIQSIVMFSVNFENYAKALVGLLTGSRLEALLPGEQLQLLTGNALDAIQGFLATNAGAILNSAANSGKQILSTVISLILAIFFLLNKKTALNGVRRLVRAFLRQEAAQELLSFLLRCDTILVSYLGQTLLDALIVGGINALVMLLFGMPYIGLVSVVVAVTNLVPNFGPVIGGVVGGFILLMVKPWYALVFLILTVLLQSADAYLLKPTLFSNSLGVSGLLILVASILFGNLFGVLGVLLAIPAAAILSFVYNEYFLPRQEMRMREAESAEEPES